MSLLRFPSRPGESPPPPGASGQAEAREDDLLWQERRQAVRLLLERPLLTDDAARRQDRETFALIRRHERWLATWFAEMLGYRLVVDAELARLHKRPARRDAAADGNLGASTAADRRALWESAGVVLDELSSQVLVLGLAPPGDRSVAAALRALAAAGQPARITLRQLGALEIAGPPPVVRVCENPVVVSAAADRLGASCPPLVCPEGVPSLAARQLLSALARTGARVLYHGDFDWPGVRIATGVADLLAATGAFAPWRFSAEDYRAALTTGVAGRQLGTGAVSTSWDPELSRAMVEAGVAVEEEMVLETLLTDLQQAATKAEASGP